MANVSLGIYHKNILIIMNKSAPIEVLKRNLHIVNSTNRSALASQVWMCTQKPLCKRQRYIIAMNLSCKALSWKIPLSLYKQYCNHKNAVTSMKYYHQFWTLHTGLLIKKLQSYLVQIFLINIILIIKHTYVACWYKICQSRLIFTKHP